MAEKAVFYARAVVYYFDPKTRGWTPTAVGSNFCRVDMYENPANNTYRVIGRGLQDTSKVVINSTLAKDTAYTRASETFHQWSDNRYIYGLNFVTKEEAESFGSGFESIVNKLKSGTATSTTPPPPAPTVAPTVAPERGMERQPSTSTPQPPKPPTTGPPAPPTTGPPAPPAPPIQSGPPTPPNPPSGGPPPPPGPPPPSKPAASSGGGGSGERSGLLSSISGFNASKLKKVETVDKSTPVVAAPKGDGGSGPRSGTVSSGSGGGGGGNMMDQILNARKKIVTNPTTPIKKESSPAPAPLKQSMNAPVKQNRSSSNSFGNSVPAQSQSPALVHASSSGSQSQVRTDELQALKEEILAEFRKEIQQMKEEILAAIMSR